MPTIPLIPETVFLDRYQVETVSYCDAVFCCGSGVDLETKTSVRLHLLLEPVTTAQITGVTEYFDVVQDVRRPVFLVPTHIQRRADCPLLLVFAPEPAETLRDALQKTPQRARELCEKASEAIHLLHNRKLTHGRIRPEYFWVEDDAVRLGGLGYAPLLSSGHEGARQEVRIDSFAAPETQIGGAPSTASDVFSFGHLLAEFYPHITTSPWYLKATHHDPSQRFERIRTAWQQLEPHFDSYTSGTPSDGPDLTKPPPPGADDFTEPDLAGSGKPSLVPKVGLVPRLRLNVEVEPAHAGRVEWQGYASGTIFCGGETVMLQAIPSSGWDFEGWKCDALLRGNPASLTVNATTHVVAKFRPLTAPDVTLIDSVPIEMDGATINTGVGVGTPSAGTAISGGRRRWLPLLLIAPLLLIGGSILFFVLAHRSTASNTREATTMVTASRKPTRLANDSSSGTPESVTPPAGVSGTIGSEANSQLIRAEDAAQDAKRIVDDIDEKMLRLQKLLSEDLLTEEQLAREQRKIIVSSKQALNLANKALRLDPKNQTAWIQKASVLFLLADYQGADAALKVSLKLFPNQVELKDLQEKIAEHRANRGNRVGDSPPDDSRFPGELSSRTPA